MPLSVIIFFPLGLCLVNMGELEKGREHLRQAIQLNKHENSYLALARVHIAEGDVQGAVDIFRVATEVYPDSVDLAVALALLYMDLSDHAKALDQFGTALAIDPSCVKAILAVGALLQVRPYVQFSCVFHTFTCTCIPMYLLENQSAFTV